MADPNQPQSPPDKQPSPSAPVNQDPAPKPPPSQNPLLLTPTEGDLGKLARPAIERDSINFVIPED